MDKPFDLGGPLSIRRSLASKSQGEIEGFGEKRGRELSKNYSGTVTGE